MTQTEALRLALEALEDYQEHIHRKKTQSAITAIKAALEAKDEPVVWNEGVPAMLPKQKEGETFIVSYEPKLEAKDEPVKLRRGDILRCNESDELCTVWATSTSGKTLVKWKDNDFGSYTAEQIGELFWIEPKEEDEPDYKALWQQMCERCDELDKKLAQRTWVGLTDEDIEQEFGFIDELLRDCVQRTEAKLKEKNT